MKKNCKNHGFPHSFIGFFGAIAVVIGLAILFVWILPSGRTPDSRVPAAAPRVDSAVVDEPHIPDKPVYFSTTMRGTPVGYEIKTWNWETEVGGPSSLEIVSQSCLKMRRGGQVTVLRMSEKQSMTKQSATGSDSRPRWRIDSFETTVQGGGQTQSVRGVLQNKQLKIYENDQLARTMTIKENFHGVLYLDHLYLEGNRPQPGQTVEIQAIACSIAADLTVRSDEAALFTNPDSPRFKKITVFQKKTDIASPSAVPLEIVWDAGDWPRAILELPGLQLRSEPLADSDSVSAAQFPERFEAIPDEQLFDLNAAMLIPVDRPVDFRAPVNRYILSLPPDALPSDDYQTISRDEYKTPASGGGNSPVLKSGSCVVTISATPIRNATVPASVPASVPAQAPAPAPLPLPETLESSPLVNYQDLRVQRLLTSESGFPAGPIDSMEQLKSAERFVSIYIKDKIYCDALADAANVVDSRRGDCTEHACLLAALLRGRNVPCRMAVGLVYVPQSQSFGFHAWNEAWLASERRWVPLDAAQSGFASDHIKFAETNFDAPSLNAAMTTLYLNMTKIKSISQPDESTP